MRQAIGLMLLWSGIAGAQQAAITALPPGELVLRAVEATPEVRAAEAALAGAKAEQRMRQLGSHETQLTVVPQQRRIDGGGRHYEWEAGLSRGVRWPGKARLDREIGDAGSEAARLRLEDAHHAGARRLLALWSNWQRASTALALQRRQVALWQRDRAAVSRRVQLGDAAGRDLMAIDAALAQARATALQAAAEQDDARLALGSRFPGVPLPEAAQLPSMPPALPGTDQAWVERILARSHETGAIEALARQKDAEARRARAERLPDPVIGVRVLNEQGGRERALGLTVSMPLGTRYRGAEAAAAGAAAMGAAAELTRVRRDVEQDARRAVATARAMHEIWRQRGEADQAARASAAKFERAYALGESDLADVLAARRLASESALAERRANVDAIEAVARVELDAHERWHRHGSGDASVGTAWPAAEP
ncbi:MAG: TolC family protein [Pseudomonadota bacterium]|jgi:outer membrane protein TolC|nr:TolC family protein [Xanthomonadaceae bacterium]MDE3209765.1 TolC family protein [Pseudomonadota bacterium]